MNVRRTAIVFTSAICLMTFIAAGPYDSVVSATQATGGQGYAQSATANSNVQTWYTNQTSFKLPFQTRVANAVEMHLYISTNRGRSWSFHSRTNPMSGSFDVKTGNAGEYWFAMRTMDRDRRVHPAGNLVAGIIVVVDQTKPEFEIQFQSDRAGRLLANWKTTDTAIDPNSIRIRYTSISATGQDTWLRVPIAAKQYQASETIVDKIAWWPGIQADRFLVEAEIKDRAGNRTVVQRTVEMQATPNTVIAATNTPPLGVSQLPVTKNADNNSAVAQHEAGNAADQQTAKSQVWDSKVSDDQHQVIASASTGSNMFDSDPARQLDYGNQSADSVDSMAQNSNQDVNQFQTGSQVPAQFASSGSHAPPSNNPSNLVAAAQPISTAQFALNYTVDAIGPAGVKQVQLWGTVDGGRNWQHWSNDDDFTSPLVVNALGDGIYGFRIVVMDKSGLVGTPPSQGDSPDVLVRIDTTAPIAKIISAPYGTGEDAGKLAIHWETSDIQLGLRPITLSYGESRQGPWNTIEKDLRDTGYYAWKTERQTPHQVYLRIDVVDQAGNQNFFVTSDPIDVSGLIPRGRVRGVSPIK